MFLLIPPATAGLINSLTPDERQVAICQEAAAPPADANDYGRAAGIWEACLAEARRTQATGAIALLEDQLALTKARARAAEWRTSDPNRYAQDVLSVASELRTLNLLGTEVASIFRAWMGTVPGKGRLEPLRTVTVIWQDTPAVEAAEASEHFQRYLQDLGLKWSDPGKPEVDVIVYASLTVSSLQPTSTGPMGSLRRVEARIESKRVRFRTIDASSDGFRVTASAEEAEAEVATQQALEGACERAAARVLKQVLVEVFR